ncbi:MAG: iron ABC transporter permease [Desulfosarcinaceae bacterium]|nr:iron ABC transporter permease [Desulfosarcinaceae bacterium]
MRPAKGAAAGQWRRWLAVPPLAFLGLFYFYPLMRILGVSLTGPDGALWAPLQRLMVQDYYLRVLGFTCGQAILSTLITLAASLPAAFVFARFSFPAKKLILALTSIPFVLPTVVVAAAYDALLGPQGVVNEGLMALFDLATAPVQLKHRLTLILLAHLFYNFTIGLRIIGGYWSQLPETMTASATTLGAAPLQVFRTITLPILKPAIWSAALLIFIFCFSSFGVILILGGPRMATLEVEIYRQTLHLFNLPMAAVLSLVQIAFTFTAMGVYTRLQRRAAVAITPSLTKRAAPQPDGVGQWMLVAGTLFAMLVYLGAPLLALLLRSVMTTRGLALTYYRQLFQNPEQSFFFVPPISAIGNSLFFATSTLVLAVVLGVTAAAYLAGPRSRLNAFLDPLFMLPLSTSAVTLGFGFLIALDRPPLNLRTSLWLIPLAHTLVAFPFVVRSVLPALRSIPASLREAAALLGASPSQVWRTVDVPIMGRALAVGAVFAFTISLGEFGATAFTAQPQRTTIPLAIYRFLGQPGALNYGQAMAMSSLLMLVTACGFLALERLGDTAGREF